MKPQAFMFMGRPGSGKGTQAQLIMEELMKKDPARKILHIETGSILRKFNQGPSHTAQLVRSAMDAGALLPEFMPIYLWAGALIEQFAGRECIVFDGTPRKLLEGQVLAEALPFYNMTPTVIYLDVHHEEALNRLVLRGKKHGRADDVPHAIERRRIAYENENKPTVDFFRGRKDVKFYDIDGIGSIDEVHARIVKALGLE